MAPIAGLLIFAVIVSWGMTFLSLYFERNHKRKTSLDAWIFNSILYSLLLLAWVADRQRIYEEFIGCLYLAV